MEFVSSFLDINFWVSIINVVLLPLQTLTNLLFDLLPTMLEFLNSIFSLFGEFASFLADFLKRVFDAFSGLNDLILPRLLKLLEDIFDILYRFIDWVADALYWFFDLFGKKNSPGGEGFSGGGMGVR